MQLEMFPEIKRGPVDIGEVLGELGNEDQIPTGFIDIDRILHGGLGRRNLVVLGAATSMGKTAMAANLALEASRKGSKTLFLSLEHSAKSLVSRILSNQSAVSLDRWQAGSTTSNEKDKLSRATGVLGELPIRIDEEGIVDFNYIAHTAHTESKTKGLDFLIVDHFQLIQGFRRPELPRDLRRLAVDLNIPVLVLSQLSRAVDRRYDKVPRISDLMQGAKLSQSADLIMLIYREDFYDSESEKRGIAELHIAKNRNGPVGFVNLLFLDRTCRFVDLEIFTDLDRESP